VNQPYYAFSGHRKKLYEHNQAGWRAETGVVKPQERNLPRGPGRAPKSQWWKFARLTTCIPEYQVLELIRTLLSRICNINRLSVSARESPGALL
jgi:hypothetical protein